jgi:4'-phosphopantetheinyl transferase
VYVYIAKIKDILLCSESLEDDSNKVSRQRHAGLNLLKYAVKDIWGIDEDLNKIKVDNNGKPYIDGYNFSISHCGGLVCVAISKINVGVDLECKTTRRQWDRLIRRVLTPSEKESIMSIDNQTITELWTKKEAIFKLLGDKVFSPSNIDVRGYHTDTLDNIDYEDDTFILSVATNEESNNYLFVKKAFLSNNIWELD